MYLIIQLIGKDYFISLIEIFVHFQDARLHEGDGSNSGVSEEVEVEGVFVSVSLEEVEGVPKVMLFPIVYSSKR